MSKKREFLNKTIIIVLSFCMFLSGLGLIVAGMRTKKKIWTISGLLYTIAGWTSMVFGLVGIYMLLWLASIIHTVKIGKEYCMRLNVIRESKDILQKRKKDLEEQRQQDIYREIIGESVECAIPEEVEIAAIDVNTCKETELASVPGIGLILARRVMDIRKEKAFSSMEDFYSRLGIDEYKRNVMAGYLACDEKAAVSEGDKIQGQQSAKREKNVETSVKTTENTSESVVRHSGRRIDM